ncbi:DUF5683 domain-containing protein [Edaphocola aurantiacus]|uniref:DUF5683 domain-containing protein n=1 Tax=Edaphocola aurantiacus TaxID=2601682 RepID=UPI001C95A518|nr:DUF5683 domain-containing protein [Edaphocola aurantiacus]
MNHITASDKHTILRRNSRNRVVSWCFFLLIIITCACSSSQTSAQEPLSTATPDTVSGLKVMPQTTDSSAIVVLPETKRHGVFSWKDSVIIPKRSALYSMLFPGLGQLNNKQYWKLPVVYGLLGVGVYFFQDNLKNYNQFRLIYANRLNNVYTDKYVGLYDDVRIKNERDYYKKYLDMTVLIGAVGYGLQIMDANVFAHLKNFDISNDIAFRIKPSFQPTPWGLSPGVGVAFLLK